MAKKYRLTGDFSPEYTVIGLTSQSRGYKLAIMVNEKLELHLRRVQDFPGQGPRESLNYPLYQDEDRELRRTYNLLFNRNPERLLVPALKGIDAFLVLFESLSPVETGALLTRLRKGTGIQAAYDIQVQTVKDLDPLMQDLEVHLMNLKKTEEE